MVFKSLTWSRRPSTSVPTGSLSVSLWILYGDGDSSCWEELLYKTLRLKSFDLTLPYHFTTGEPECLKAELNYPSIHWEREVEKAFELSIPPPSVITALYFAGCGARVRLPLRSAVISRCMWLLWNQSMWKEEGEHSVEAREGDH